MKEKQEDIDHFMKYTEAQWDSLFDYYKDHKCKKWLKIYKNLKKAVDKLLSSQSEGRSAK